MAGGDPEQRFEALVAAMRIAVPALRDAEVPFLLGGSMALWAYGGPQPLHDLDLMVRPRDADAALAALTAAGLRPEHPPEDWLVKAWHGDALVDVIFAPRGLPITDDVLARGRMRNLAALRVPVMSPEDVLTTKLLALDEHQLDLSGLLQVVRPIREQIDWAELHRRTGDSPYAAAFHTLVERLGVSSGPARVPAGEDRKPREERAMATCEVCGNDYDRPIELTVGGGEPHVFDSFECAIHALAPTCEHCGCRVIGHGVQAGESTFCCAHCAQAVGVGGARDRV